MSSSPQASMFVAPIVEASLELAALVERAVLERVPASDVRRFVVPGPPQPWQRPQPIRNKRGKIIGMATPSETIRAQQRVRDSFSELYPGHKLWTRPVVLIVRSYVQDRIHRDWDNLAKLVSDALNRRPRTDEERDPTAAWVDDSQIVTAFVAKCLDRKNPRTEVFAAAMSPSSSSMRED